ncbi:MAG: hypothetical protein LC798_06835 [Chloroflexi bacterium]|nr:hypothetical protein [Chloroflexota bacterium]
MCMLSLNDSVTGNCSGSLSVSPPMEETITMSGKGQRRAWMMTKPLVGELTVVGRRR